MQIIELWYHVSPLALKLVQAGRNVLAFTNGVTVPAEGRMTEDICDLILRVLPKRKVCVQEVKAGPSIRVMIRPLWSDMSSRRTICGAFRGRSKRLWSGSLRVHIMWVASVLVTNPPAGGRWLWTVNVITSRNVIAHSLRSQQRRRKVKSCTTLCC